MYKAKLINQYDEVVATLKPYDDSFYVIEDGADNVLFAIGDELRVEAVWEEE